MVVEEWKQLFQQTFERWKRHGEVVTDWIQEVKAYISVKGDQKRRYPIHLTKHLEAQPLKSISFTKTGKSWGELSEMFKDLHL